MPAYILANIEVTDAAGFERYRAAVPLVIERFGGRYLVRGGASEVVEGGYPGHRFVVLEFPDRATAEAFWRSPDYAACKELRAGAAEMAVAIVEGYTP